MDEFDKSCLPFQSRIFDNDARSFESSSPFKRWNCSSTRITWLVMTTITPTTRLPSLSILKIDYCHLAFNERQVVFCLFVIVETCYCNTTFLSAARFIATHLDCSIQQNVAQIVLCDGFWAHIPVLHLQTECICFCISCGWMPIVYHFAGHLSVHWKCQWWPWTVNQSTHSHAAILEFASCTTTILYILNKRTRT